MGKREIRLSIKQLTLALDPKESLEQAENVMRHIGSIIAQRAPRTVALFAPLRDEIPLGELTQRVDCKVVLPRVKGEDMEFYDYDAEAMAVGAFGISEPQGEVPVAAEEIDLMVVPGVAFTRAGDRLGRGKGYYDRYLSREGFRAYCVGVCYEHQVVDELPVEPHDRRMDKVVSGNFNK